MKEEKGAQLEEKEPQIEENGAQLDHLRMLIDHKKDHLLSNPHHQERCIKHLEM